MKLMLPFKVVIINAIITIITLVKLTHFEVTIEMSIEDDVGNKTKNIMFIKQLMLLRMNKIRFIHTTLEKNNIFVF